MEPAQVFYQCQRCGHCCRWPGFVRLQEEEIGEIAAFLGLETANFTEIYTDLHPNRSGLVLKNRPGGACIFLEEEGGTSSCRIQKAKPRQCRAFPNQWNFPGWREVCEALPVPREAHTKATEGTKTG